MDDPRRPEPWLLTQRDSRVMSRPPYFDLYDDYFDLRVLDPDRAAQVPGQPPIRLTAHIANSLLVRGEDARTLQALNEVAQVAGLELAWDSGSANELSQVLPHAGLSDDQRAELARICVRPVSVVRSNDPGVFAPIDVWRLLQEYRVRVGSDSAQHADVGLNHPLSLNSPKLPAAHRPPAEFLDSYQLDATQEPEATDTGFAAWDGTPFVTAMVAGELAAELARSYAAGDQAADADSARRRMRELLHRLPKGPLGAFDVGLPGPRTASTYNKSAARPVPVQWLGPQPQPAHDAAGRPRPVVAIVAPGVGAHEWLGDAVVHRSVEVLGMYIGTEAGGPLGTQLDLDHGTFAAGIVRQLCPEALVVSIPFPPLATEGDLLLCLQLLALRQVLARNGVADYEPVDVVTLPVGFYHEQPEEPAFNSLAFGVLHLLGKYGASIIAAAGNDATSRPQNPAVFAPHPSSQFAATDDASSVVTVGTVSSDGSASWSGNSGPWVGYLRPSTPLVSTLPVIYDAGFQPSTRRFRRSVDLPTGPRSGDRVAGDLIAPSTSEEQGKAVAGAQSQRDERPAFHDVEVKVSFGRFGDDPSLAQLTELLASLEALFDLAIAGVPGVSVPRLKSLSYNSPLELIVFCTASGGAVTALTTAANRIIGVYLRLQKARQLKTEIDTQVLAQEVLQRELGASDDRALPAALAVTHLSLVTAAEPE